MYQYASVSQWKNGESAGGGYVFEYMPGVAGMLRAPKMVAAQTMSRLTKKGATAACSPAIRFALVVGVGPMTAPRADRRASDRRAGDRSATAASMAGAVSTSVSVLANRARILLRQGHYRDAERHVCPAEDSAFGSKDVAEHEIHRPRGRIPEVRLMRNPRSHATLEPAQHPDRGNGREQK